MGKIKGWTKTVDNSNKKILKSSVIMGWSNIISNSGILIKITRRGNYELVDTYGNEYGVADNLSATKNMAVKYMRSHPRG